MDWIVAALVLLGAYLLGDGNKEGWRVNFLSCVIYAPIAFNKELYGIVALQVFCAILAVRGYNRWKKEEQEEQSKK